MIASMTAFARAERSAGGLTVTVEVRTVNGRYLDTVLRLPHAYASLEERIKGRVARHLQRGRVDLRLSARDERSRETAYEVDLPLAAAYRDALVRLRDALGLAGEIPLTLLAGVPGVIRPGEAGADPAADWPLVAECLEAALADLTAMRRREGDELAADIGRRLDAIAVQIDRIEAESEGLLETYRQRLEARIAALTGGTVPLDPGRLAQEAALLADRSDISEEVVRTRSHLGQFRHLMAAPEAAGRTLNFLLQELNRELNTVGSKTDRAAVAHRVVTVKAEIEKLREQIQNVE